MVLTNKMAISLLQVIIFSVLYTIVYSAYRQEEKKLILFTRHGARSPNKYTEMDKELWNSFPPGFLTRKGFKQLIQLGEHYQSLEIYDENGLCVYEKMHIEASTKQRVMLSTIGFVQGLCPQNFAAILRRFFNEYYAQYATNAEDLELLLNSDFTNPFDFDYDGFERPNDFMFHGHDSKVCPILDQVEEAILEQAYYLQRQAEFKQRREFEEVYQQMKLANPSKNITKESLTVNQMKTFYGGYKCNQFEGFDFPNLSQEAQAYLDEIFQFKFYYVDNSDDIQHLSSTTEIFKWVIKELDSDVPFSWYSGHDSNQVAILAVITDELLTPPFASNIELNIYGETVNLYFQGERIPTRFCQAGINCSKTDVKRYLQRFIASDLNGLCQPNGI